MEIIMAQNRTGGGCVVWGEAAPRNYRVTSGEGGKGEGQMELFLLLQTPWLFRDLCDTRNLYYDPLIQKAQIPPSHSEKPPLLHPYLALVTRLCPSLRFKASKALQSRLLLPINNPLTQPTFHHNGFQQRQQDRPSPWWCPVRPPEQHLLSSMTNTASPHRPQVEHTELEEELHSKAHIDYDRVAIVR